MTDRKPLPILPPRAGCLVYKEDAVRLVGWSDTIEGAHGGGWALTKGDEKYLVPEWMCSSLATDLLRAAATGSAKDLVKAMSKSETHKARSHV